MLDRLRLGTAYRETFDSSKRWPRVVLVDLAHYCFANRTTHTGMGARGVGELEGRRQVWLRLQQFKHMTEEEIRELSRQVSVGEGGQNDRSQ